MSSDQHDHQSLDLTQRALGWGIASSSGAILSVILIWIFGGSLLDAVLGVVLAAALTLFAERRSPQLPLGMTSIVMVGFALLIVMGLIATQRVGWFVGCGLGGAAASLVRVFMQRRQM